MPSTYTAAVEVLISWWIRKAILRIKLAMEIVKEEKEEGEEDKEDERRTAQYH
jgi:hypothetical protein